MNCFRLLDNVAVTVDNLLATPDIIIGEQVLEDNEVLDKALYKVRGCILTIMERLDEEFTKLLKECDPHSNEYVERYILLTPILNSISRFVYLFICNFRLKDETRVALIIDKVQEYYERQGISAELCRIYLRKIEHLYYKFDPDVLKLKEVCCCS